MPRRNSSETDPINDRIAALLGWQKLTRKRVVTAEQHYRWLEASRGMFGAPDAPVPNIGVHEEIYWLNPDGREGFSPRNWAGWLEQAWQLHSFVPPNVILFDLTWVHLDQFDVAWYIALSFLKYKESLSHT